MTPGAAGRKARRLPSALPSLIGVPLFAWAVWVIARELGGVGWGSLVHDVLSIPGGTLALSVGLTGAAYALLTSYDVLAFRYIGRELSRGKIMLAAFIGYAFSNSISMTPSLAARYRLYSRWGLRAPEVARVFFFHLLSTWLGFLVVAGVILVLEPRLLDPMRFLASPERRGLGVVLLLLVAAYFVGARHLKDGVAIRGTRFHPPRAGILLRQIAVATADWTLVGLVPYALLHSQLPESGQLSYLTFLGVFLAAQLVQIVSHVPGGIGIFEGTVLLLLRSEIPPSAILASLIVYRAVYTVLPLAIAAPLYVGLEVLPGRRAR